MGLCCGFTKQIIKAFDCFGTPITFRINDDVEYKSLMGGISSLFFIITASLYIAYNSYFFIFRKNVDFIYSKKTINAQPMVDFERIGYRFAFGLQYMSDHTSTILNTTKYFNYSITEVQIFNSERIIEKPIKIEFCTKAHFRNIVNRTFDLRGLKNMYCPILDGVNFTVEGTMMDPYYKYYNLEIWLTDYALKNYQELQNYADAYPLEMSYYFLDNAIDYENRKEPIPHFLNYIFKGLDVIYEKDTEIILSPMEFSNDENIILNNPHKLYGCTVDDQSDSFHAVTEPNHLGQALVGKYIVKASPIMFTLSRTYQKLPSFVADLSGILDEILALILLCVNILERQAIDNKLIKKMIKFKGSKNCDVDYLLYVFNNYNNNNSSQIMNIINSERMLIKRNTIGGVNSAKKNFNIYLRKKSLYARRNNFLNDNYLLKGLKPKKHMTEITHDENIKLQTKEKNGFDMLNLNNYNNNISNNEKRLSSSRSFADSINSVYPKVETIYNNKRKIITNLLSMKKSFKRNKCNENYVELGIFEALWSKLFFWTSKRQERRREFFSNAEEKIHNYFDVYNYIKKMQEVDLLVYTLLDYDQVKLFDFLSRPPLKIAHDKFDLYNEFQSRQSLNIKIKKKQIDDLYLAYNNIREKDEQNFEDLKLMRLINAEVKFLN